MSFIIDYPINAMTFGFMSTRGQWSQEARSSLKLLKERCAINTVILPIVANQDTAQSTEIHWNSEEILSDEEIKEMIYYAKSLGLKVILKPMVNVSDGTWRAHINFFDHDVPCEPKWSEWFSSYQKYLLYYANLAEETKCDMFVVGCELVNSDRREKEWRETIALVRKIYSGLLTYNCDKYQEENVSWWDALDVISSSGYYPIDVWEEQLKRIEKTVKKYQKPFFFCEVGCPSRKGSEFLPNDWSYSGEINLKSQEDWFKRMFNECKKYSWVQGFGIWDWKSQLYPLHKAYLDDDYAVFGKPAEKIIADFYKSIK